MATHVGASFFTPKSLSVTIPCLCHQSKVEGRKVLSYLDIVPANLELAVYQAGLELVVGDFYLFF